MSSPRPRLRQVVLDSTDARRSAEFWRQLLGLIYRPGHEPPASGDDDTAGRDWLNLRGEDGTAYLAIQQVETLPTSTWPSDEVPQQLHLDLSVPDKDSLDRAHEQVLQLGGTLRLDRSDNDEEPLRVYAIRMVTLSAFLSRRTERTDQQRVWFNDISKSVGWVAVAFPCAGNVASRVGQQQGVSVGRRS